MHKIWINWINRQINTGMYKVLYEKIKKGKKRGGEKYQTWWNFIHLEYEAIDLVEPFVVLCCDLGGLPDLEVPAPRGVVAVAQFPVLPLVHHRHVRLVLVVEVLKKVFLDFGFSLGYYFCGVTYSRSLIVSKMVKWSKGQSIPCIISVMLYFINNIFCVWPPSQEKKLFM